MFERIVPNGNLTGALVVNQSCSVLPCGISALTLQHVTVHFKIYRATAMCSTMCSNKAIPRSIVSEDDSRAGPGINAA